MISTYAPYITISKEERAFYEQLQNMIDKIRANHLIIIKGHLNARIGNNTFSRVEQPFLEAINNDTGDVLTDS